MLYFDALIKHTPPIFTLFVLFDELNQRTSIKSSMRKMILKRLLISSLLLCSNVYAKLNLELPKQNAPSTAQHATAFTSTPANTNNGLDILRRLRSSGRIIEDPEINLWIQSLGNRLTANASHSSSPFYFLVSQDLSVNAFATQGGVIVVNAGAILRSDSESELAAIIAHEIAHITQRHIDRMIAKSKNNSLIANAAILAGILASSKSPEAGQAILNTTFATMAHKQLSFSREAESEADRVGLRILVSAGFNPQAMPLFLQKLESLNDGKYESIREFLQNHPLTHKRVTDTRIRANKLGRFRGRENISYLYMREKIRALAHSRTPAKATLTPSIKKYSEAIRLKQAGNLPLALSVLGNSSKQVSEAVLISSLLNKQRRYKESIKLLVSLLKTYPEDLSLSIPLAQAYIATGKPENAWITLDEIVPSEQTSLLYFEVKQEAARLSRRLSQAYYAVASKNIRTGSYEVAETQLRQAIRSVGSNENQLRQIQHDLGQVKLLIRNAKQK